MSSTVQLEHFHCPQIVLCNSADDRLHERTDYQDRRALLSFDAHILYLESEDGVWSDGHVWVFSGDEGLLVVRVVHVAGNLRVRDEGFACSYLHLDADSLHSRDHAVQDLSFQRTIDHGLEADGEYGLSSIVDESLLDALDPRMIICLLVDGNEVAILDVAAPEQSIESGLGQSTCC